jgi:hypothetical protein
MRGVVIDEHDLPENCEVWGPCSTLAKYFVE